MGAAYSRSLGFKLIGNVGNFCGQVAVQVIRDAIRVRSDVVLDFWIERPDVAVVCRISVDLPSKEGYD